MDATCRARRGRILRISNFQTLSSVLAHTSPFLGPSNFFKAFFEDADHAHEDDLNDVIDAEEGTEDSFDGHGDLADDFFLGDMRGVFERGSGEQCLLSPVCPPLVLFICKQQ